MLLVFKHPRFRLLWLNSVFSDAGTIILIMSQGLLALELTGSEFWLGAVAGVNGIAILSFSLIAGVMADRIDRRFLVALAGALDVAVAASLALLLFFGVEALWHLLLGGVVNGIAISTRMPARNALTLDLVGRDNLIKATAANFAAIQLVAIVAPLLTGLVITAFDLSWAYVMVAVSAGMGVLSLVTLRGVSKPTGRAGPPLKDLMEGAKFVFRAPTVRSLILLAIVAEIFAWSHETMLPVIAEVELGVGASGYGYILSAAGAGALVTTIAISSMREVGRKGVFALVGLSMFGGFLILFSLSPWLSLSLILITLAYSGAMAYETMLGALLQMVVPDEMRGRVLSFQTATWGLTGASGFHTGAIATALGAPIAIALGGAVVLVNAVRVAPQFLRLDERAADQSDDD
jgi:predicted MFS family arabinose efflux permease